MEINGKNVILIEKGQNITSRSKTSITGIINSVDEFTPRLDIADERINHQKGLKVFPASSTKKQQDKNKHRKRIKEWKSLTYI